jgi:hypothetical protein
MPNDDPRLRASDEDRDRTASLLREHHAAGRLTVEEFSERLDAAYEAKTLGQLHELLADLPNIDLYRLPEQSMRRDHASGSLVPGDQPGRLSPVWRHHWASWASVSILLFAIWLVSAITSHSVAGLWFLWVTVPWGAILLSRWLFGQHPNGGGPGPRLQPGPMHGIDGTGDSPGDSAGQAFDAHRQHVDDHLRRHQEHMQRRQEQMQRRQQQMQDRQQRRQDRMQQRQDRHGRPEED